MRAPALSIFLLASASLAAAQTTGQIAGTVRNAWTNAPLERAAVTLATTGANPLEALAYSDTQGRFTFSGLPPGSYYLTADLSGYDYAVFGRGQSQRLPKTIAIRAAQRKRADLPMYPLASLSGRVLDIAGYPVAGGYVELLLPRYRRGKRVWLPSNTTEADSYGNYRMSLLHPGTYRVRAGSRRAQALKINPDVTNGDAGRQEFYGVQFYPNADSPEQGSPLTVSAGTDLKGIDFNLPYVRPVAISGGITAPTELTPDTPIHVRLIPAGSASFRRRGPSADVTGPSRRFTFAAVTPGSYRLLAFASFDDRNYRGFRQLTLDTDQGDLTIDLAAGTPLKGKLEIQGDPSKKPDEFEANLSSEEIGSAESAEINEDGTFEFDSIPPGTWDIGLTPLPEGFFIQSMRYGNQDVLNEDMLLEGGNRQELTIVISAGAAAVKGSILSEPREDAEPVRGFALLVPAEPLDHVLSYYQRAVADAAGRFLIKGITPGKYRLLAFDELEADEYQDANFLKPHLARTQPFEIKKGEQLDRNVAIILRNSGSP